MPDTMIQSTPATVVSEYRSPLIGQLVAARAKATKEIKTIIKDKQAEIPTKNGGRGYSYSYADLAGVMEAVEDALAAQEMALFQTLQDRGGKTVLVTTLAHSSDQWISSEVAVSSPTAGPQVFGSSLTYMRRYSALAILGIAPDTDDDGKAAQDRADQQPRQQPQERAKPAQRPMPTTPKTQAAPAASDEPQRVLIQHGGDGPLLGRWTKQAIDALDGKPPEWRRKWMDLHSEELAELRWSKPDYYDRIDAAVIGSEAA